MYTDIMNINKLAKATLVAGLVVLVTFSVMKLSKADVPNCNAQSVLSGSILSTGEFGGGALAVVTNNSDCSFNVGLDAYQTSNNQLFDSLGSGLAPHQTVELHINVPNCQYRLELSAGDVILESQTVRSNLCGAPAPTPTSAPSSFYISGGSCFGWPTPVVEVNAVQSSGANTYSVQRRQGSGSWSTLQSGMDYSALDRFSDTSVQINGSYDYRVIAVNNSGSTVSSNTFPITVNGPSCGATPTPAPTPTPTPSCTGNIYDNITGDVVSVNGSTATGRVTNNSNCTYTVSLAAYKQFSTGADWITTQTLYDSKTVTLSPHQTIDTNVLIVSVPACHFQVDLVEGSPIVPPNYGGAGHALFDVQYGGGDLCGSVAIPAPVLIPVVSVPSCSNTDYVAQISYPAVNNNIRIFIDDAVSSPSAWDKVLNGSNGSTLAPAGFNPRLPGMPSLTLQPGVRYYSFIQNNNSSVDGPMVNWIVNACPTPTPVPPTPTPVPPTPTPVPPTPTPVIISYPMPVIVNSPCAINATNSCNTITNTSTITQTGTGNNAQVNQSGAIGGNTGSQQNIYLPLLAAVVATPTPTPTPNPILTSNLNISKMVRNISGNTSEVKSVNANVNDTVEFVIRVSTSNNQTATNVRVTDSLPYGLTYLAGSTTIDNSYLNDGVTSNGISLGSFNPGRLATIRFRATVGQGYNYNQSNYGSTTFTNSASAYADNAPTVTDSASVIVTTIQPNQSTLTIQKTARNISTGGNIQQTSLNARAGDGIEFTITVTAPYNTNLTNVVVSDLLPAGMKYTVNSTTLNNIVTTDGIVAGGLNIGSLSAGQKAEIKFYATINAGVAVNQQLVNTANAHADNVSSINSNPVYITIGNSAVLAAALHVRTGPAGDAFALAGFGGLFSSALYAARRKVLGLVKLA